ncbi:CDP-diacylglycerol--glycerol-3-phosphate 3-phosphatidyltransferase [Thermodesulfobacteriota bacterium]
MTVGSKIKQNISNPNMLTLFRIAATPIIIVLLLFPNRICTFLAAIMFSAAAITDYLDGFFARKKGMVSNLGKIMDPLADKLLVSSSFIMLVWHHWAPAWVACIIIGREIAVTGLRTVLVDQKENISSSWLGKYKTGFQISAIIPLLIHFPYFGINFHAIGCFFLWGALVMTIWSGADYFIRFRRLLEN